MDFNKLLHYKSKTAVIVEIPFSDIFRWYRNVKNGKLHRFGNLPAIKNKRSDGRLEWYQNGKLHRDDDKPAVIFADGTKLWYQNGKLHRDNDKQSINCRNLYSLITTNGF
jgi:antitoxin component YwqK of YwqJK toxin-antitoxin module